MNGRKYNLKQQFYSNAFKTYSEYYRTQKFRLLHNYKRNNNKNFKAYLKSNTINSINSETFFNSFHKFFMHGKLSSNPKYINIQNKIYYTDRDKKLKNYIENYTSKNSSNNSSFKNKYEKLFLTNNNYLYNQENRNYNYLTNKDNQEIIELKSKPQKVLTDYNTTEIQNDKTIRFRSNVFLPLDFKKFRNCNYPDRLYVKISDFIENIKMLRLSKFINNLKTEQNKKKSNMVGFEKEAYDMTLNSLTITNKLLNSYKESFLNYNKFLIEQIKKEKKVLNNYIIDENILKEEVVLVQKKFDDSMIELEILNNFKNLFNAIKNRTKLRNDENSNKTFVEMIKEKLKSKIKFKKKITFKILPKKDYMKKHSKIAKKEENKHLNEKIEKHERLNRLNHTAFNAKTLNIKREEKKIERFHSVKHLINVGKINISKIIEEKDDDMFENFDVQKELNSIGNNILELIKRFNKINYDAVYFKLLFKRESNSIDIFLKNKQIQGAKSELEYCKKYNSLLTTKLKLLKSQNEDYSLFFFIYHKLNRMIKYLRIYKVKKYQSLIDKLLNIYDNNTIFNAFKTEKNGKTTRLSSLEEELINYIYKVLMYYENLEFKLIQGKNQYLKSNYYSERIEEFENKIDNAKKLFNNQSKKKDEIIRREKVREKTINKLKKLIFLPMKKVANNYKIYNSHTKSNIKKNVTENEIENILFY